MTKYKFKRIIDIVEENGVKLILGVLGTIGCMIITDHYKLQEINAKVISLQSTVASRAQFLILKQALQDHTGKQIVGCTKIIPNVIEDKSIIKKDTTPKAYNYASYIKR